MKIPLQAVNSHPAIRNSVKVRAAIKTKNQRFLCDYELYKNVTVCVS